MNGSILRKRLVLQSSEWIYYLWNCFWGMKWKTTRCKFKYVITSEKGLSRARNYLDLIIYASNYYFFQKDRQSCILNIWKNKQTNHNREGLLLNPYRTLQKTRIWKQTRKRKNSRIWIFLGLGNINTTHIIL